MCDESLLSRIQELKEKGKEMIQNDDIECANLMWCPICDKTEWDILNSNHQLEQVGDKIDCNHEDFFLYEGFNMGTYVEDNLTIIQKYKRILNKLSSD